MGEGYEKVIFVRKIRICLKKKRKKNIEDICIPRAKLTGVPASAREVLLGNMRTPRY